MHAPCLAACSALALLASARAQEPRQPSPPAPLVLTRSIELPKVKGRIDHFAYDPKTQRLFVAALGNGSLEVLDVAKGEPVRSIQGLQEPQGVAIVAATGQVVVACGLDGVVFAYDTATLKQKAKVHVGDDADNVRVAQDGKTVLVGHSQGALELLDAANLAVTGSIALPGHPESFQLEPGTSRAFVNVPEAKGGPVVVVVDLKARTVQATFKLTDAASNFPLALAGAHQLVFVGCREPARLLGLDPKSGKVLVNLGCVADTDDLFCDAKSGRVLVIGGGGTIDVFASDAAAKWQRTASVPTAAGARTGLFVPELRKLFLAVPKREGQHCEIREFTLRD